MREFYFLRHGQTDWNVAGRMQGRSDIPLNDTGIAQALSTAEYYATSPVDRIVSSPQLRARVTAQHISDRLGVPLEFDPRLVERCIGALEGMTKAEVADGDPALLYDDQIPNDWLASGFLPRRGETKAQVAERAHAAVMEHLARYPGEKILFVAHGAWFRALAHRLHGQDIYSDNAVPYIFTPQGNAWQVRVAAA